MNFLVFEDTKFNHELSVFMLDVDQGGWIPPCLRKMIPYRAWDDAHSLWKFECSWSWVVPLLHLIARHELWKDPSTLISIFPEKDEV